MIPTENKVKVKNGKRKTITERIFPGYVLVKMIVTDASWYCVRNTPNVTGFVGTGTVPTPIAESEITDLKKRMGHQETTFILDAQEGDIVKVTDGPFKDYEGKVSQVDETRGKVKVLVSMFGRETPLELDFLQVKKI
jgi:transcriptional antiterminator NusG